MPSPVEPPRGTLRLALAVLRHEISTLLRARAFWVLLVLLSLLTGYGFVEAVRLFSAASASVPDSPELARGMVPLDGVLVPLLGAFHLGTILLFPFVAIGSLGQDRDSGALKLVLQWPLSTATVIGLKFLAVVVVWFVIAAVPLSALWYWHWLGGHLDFAETANLLVGHFLYALVVIGVALIATAATASAASAAIVTLAFTLGFWVLDFAASSATGGLQRIVALSPTSALGRFEEGLFSWPHALALAALGLGLAAMAAQLLEPAIPRVQRGLRLTGIAVTAALLISAVDWARGAVDVTEDRRNSFSVSDEQALRRMDDGLTVGLHLSPDDSRAQELSSNVLSKLQRLVPGLSIVWLDAGASGPFAAPEDDRYGLIEFRYRGAKRETRSNSAREILPLLHALAGATVTADDAPPYRGYPLVADARASQWWFYVGLPGLAFLGMWRIRRSRSIPRFLTAVNQGDPT